MKELRGIEPHSYWFREAKKKENGGWGDSILDPVFTKKIWEIGLGGIELATYGEDKEKN